MMELNSIKNSSLPTFTISNFQSNDCDALKGIIEETPLSNVFFSQDNIQYISNTVRQKIYEKTNTVIASLENKDLFIIMRAIFLEYSDSASSGVKNQLLQLNKKIIDKVYDTVYENFKEYYNYLTDISSDRFPVMDRPEWMSDLKHSGDFSSRNSFT